MGTVYIDNPITLIKKQAEESGRKSTTGTYVPTQEGVINNIQHNLGVVPSMVFLYPTNLEEYDENYSNDSDAAKRQVKYFFGNHYTLPNNTVLNVGLANQGNSNTGIYSWQPILSTYYKPTDTIFTVSGTQPNNYYMSVGVEYTWIAIE